MRIRLLAVSARQPAWVNSGYQHFVSRLGRECPLEMVEVPLARGRSRSVEAAMADEAKRLLRRIPADAHVVALDVAGSQWSSQELAVELQRWQGQGPDCYLLIGGPDGLDSTCLARANQRWSLSSLTLPHGLVRIVVAEALYRAVCIRRGHPYHK
ncbi:MAG: 23S rRNA (pseudouridine(1915)-N(3))-methyltransferase RlmH [Gammaproteobacteria bacterium]